MYGPGEIRLYRLGIPVKKKKKDETPLSGK
jgi:hypothetical protein